MREAVRQSVHKWRGLQANPKKTTTNFWISHYSANLTQRFQRHFGVCMQKPENIAGGCIGSGIHLFRTAALAGPDYLIAEALRQSVGAVSARTIDDNNFRFTQIREKWAYRRSLIKDWNNNRDLH